MIKKLLAALLLTFSFSQAWAVEIGNPDAAAAVQQAIASLGTEADLGALLKSAADIAKNFPASAPEIAAFFAENYPGFAANIAGAVAQAVPGSAEAIGNAVAAAVPSQSRDTIIKAAAAGALPGGIASNDPGVPNSTENPSQTDGNYDGS